MTDQMITLPMKVISKHAVSVGGSDASCMNCSAQYLGEPTCTGCGTALVFAASEKIGDGYLDLMRAFASEHGLQLVGYSGGGCLEMGSGIILSEDTYSL